jgi:hypothetical protein
MTDTDGNALCFCKPGLSGNDCLDKGNSMDDFPYLSMADILTDLNR